MYFHNTHSMKTKILSMLGTGYFLKIAKINSQQEKPISPNRKNQFPQNTKNRQSAKIYYSKNFVPYGNPVIHNVSQTIYVFCSRVNGTQSKMIASISHQRAIRIKFQDHRHQSLKKLAVSIVERLKQEQEPMTMYGLSAGTKNWPLWRGGCQWRLDCDTKLKFCKHLFIYNIHKI